MAELFSSGRIIDVILVLMLIQGLALVWLYRRRGGSLTPTDYLFNVLPGAFLMLALRAALVDASWTWVAICLTGSLVTHWLELWRRIGRR